METVPAEALALLDASADNLRWLDELGVDVHFIRPRFGRHVRVLLRDEHGRTFEEPGLLDALDLLSA